MQVQIEDGPLKSMIGEAVFIPAFNVYSVSIPTREDVRYHEDFFPHQVRVLDASETRSPNLAKKEFITLQPDDDVQVSGCKGSCSSVWCPDCFTRKGGSRRVANRLGKMNWKKVRQVVLTVDPKKYGNDPQAAFELIKEKKSIPQFIHNLKRTGRLQVEDWAWVLEWHSDGFPHWHLFVETQEGKAGMIGNDLLYRYWAHGMVFESFIKSENHWMQFTDYFGNNGYFDPKSPGQKKDKSHQLHLPEWALDQTYRIRKTGSRCLKDACDSQAEKQYLEEQPSRSRDKTPKTYRQLLGACGQSIYAMIRRGKGYLTWAKLKIPYKVFKRYSGEYIHGVGYVVQFKLDEFFSFLNLQKVGGEI